MAAPVQSERLNRWGVMVSESYAASDDELLRAVTGMLKRVGDVDAVRVLRSSPSRIVHPGGTVARREQQERVPLLRPGRVNWVLVEFAWRAPARSVPWPSEALAGGVLPRPAILNADIALDTVGTPGAPAPARTGLLPDLPSVDDVVHAAGSVALVLGLLIVIRSAKK